MAPYELNVDLSKILNVAIIHHYSFLPLIKIAEKKQDNTRVQTNNYNTSIMYLEYQRRRRLSKYQTSETDVKSKLRLTLSSVLRTSAQCRYSNKVESEHSVHRGVVNKLYGVQESTH